MTAEYQATTTIPHFLDKNIHHIEALQEFRDTIELRRAIYQLKRLKHIFSANSQKESRVYKNMAECNGKGEWIHTIDETVVCTNADKAILWQQGSSCLGSLPLVDNNSELHSSNEKPLSAILEIQHVLTKVQDLEQNDVIDTSLQSNKKPKEKLSTDDSGPVYCSICNIKLKSKKNLRAHMNTHGGEKKYHCPNCPKSFLRSYQMKSHLRVHTGERPFECDICFKTFSQPSNFTVHKNTHLSLPFKCEFCQRTFSQQLYLRTHMKTHTDRDPMQCRLCRRKYDRQEDLDRHTKEHVAQNLFSCIDCGKEFERFINLKNHRFSHNGLKPYVCTICGKAFSHTTSLAIHLRTHTGEKPYKCAKCDNTFSQWANYHRHLRTHDTKPEHRCDVCDMTFTKTSSLKSHARKHYNENGKKANYICDTCNRGFLKRGVFIKHVRAHLNGCLICGENIGGGSEYAEHMRAKHRYKKNTCEICRKHFTSIREIRQHMELVHVPQDGRLYKCDQCDLVDNEFSLDAHVRQQHPTYKMHNCPSCRLNFVHTELLLIHVKEHLGQKQCEQCGQVFRKHGLYRRHKCVRAELERELKERDEEQKKHINTAKEPVINTEGTMEETQLTLENETKEVTKTANPEDPLSQSKSSGLLLDEINEKLLEELFSENISQNISDLTESEIRTEPNIIQLEIKRETLLNSNALEESEDDAFDDVDFHMDDPQSLNSPQNKDNSTCNENQTPSFICSVCGRSFATAKRLNVHSKSHEKRRFHCDQCAMSFLRSTELKTHMRGHTGERPFQCEFCSKCFTQSSALYTHHRVHSGERPFECKICQKRFKQSSARKRHEALHTGEKPFMCPVCGKSFVNADGLQTHSKVHAAKQPKVKVRPVPLPKPIRAKPSKPDPELGPNGYYGDLPYACEVCRKTFAKACTLWMHSKIHTGEKSFKCDQCPKAFAQGSNLKRHKLSHTGKRPFQCFECTKWFAKKETLEAHMELHTEAKRQQAVSVFQMQGTSAVAAIVIAKQKVL